MAAYAWGDDYHEILAERLRVLSAFIEAKTGAPVLSRWYTDTGPVLERDLAQRAGLGWIGKNTCLIHPTQGSYFFLAEILLSIELEPDPPFPHDRCGSCTRCLEACPTACILPDRTIDARRCISYLTIELKGAIPVELRPQIGRVGFRLRYLPAGVPVEPALCRCPRRPGLCPAAGCAPPGPDRRS